MRRGERHRPLIRRALLSPLLALSLLLAACAREAPVTEWTGDWRLSLQLPGGELPAGLELREENGALAATLVNGEERIALEVLQATPGVLELRFPGLETTITARREKDRLQGDVVMIKRQAVRQGIPFVASRGADSGFFPPGEAPPAGASFAGRWAITFTDDDGATSIGVGEFRQEGDAIFGTILTPTADHRFISGQVRGDRVFLRSFNGGHAFLYHATLQGETFTGDYWSGMAWHERLDGRRDDSASLGDAENATTLRAGEDRLSFTFPDLEGRPVSIDDERFRGKVVVVTLGGSWCPNCHDEAAFFAQWYPALQPQGLEIVGLMFEQHAAFDDAAAAVRRFRDRYGVTWPLLIAGENDREQAARLLPQLSAVLAYPTTIFIDRQGKVRRIHTGFSGPATGEHHEHLKADFDRTVRELLAETA